MFGAIKRRVQEANRQREVERQETVRTQQAAREQAAEQTRRQLERREKVLAMLEEGKVPDVRLDISVPFRLLKNERLVFGLNNVGYAEMRTKREIHGRSAGSSVRVMKGMSSESVRQRAPLWKATCSPTGVPVLSPYPPSTSSSTANAPSESHWPRLCPHNIPDLAMSRSSGTGPAPSLSTSA